VKALWGDAGIKLTSLALAVLLWVVIAGEKTSEMGLSVPVELQNFPKDLELTGEPVNAIEVRVRASPGVIQQLGPGDVSAQIDLAGAGEGERIVHLTARAIRVPFGVQVVKITPSSINLNFERTLQKAVPIRPRLIGRPAEGFEVAGVGAKPAEVTIAGPKSRVLEIESAFTEPVSVDDARQNVIDVVNIGLDDPTLRIQGSPRVEVAARIRPVMAQRALLVPIEARAGVQPVRPTSARVVLVGPATTLQRLETGDVRAWLDLPGERETLAAVRVELTVPLPGVVIESVTPLELPFRVARDATGRPRS
jgi:YbbR domain-containing protein